MIPRWTSPLTGSQVFEADGRESAASHLTSLGARLRAGHGGTTPTRLTKGPSHFAGTRQKCGAASVAGHRRFSAGPAVPTLALAGLDRLRMVLSAMLGWGHTFQIVERIVQLVSVDMVDVMSFRDGPVRVGPHKSRVLDPHIRLADLDPCSRLTGSIVADTNTDGSNDCLVGRHLACREAARRRRSLAGFAVAEMRAELERLGAKNGLATPSTRAHEVSRSGDMIVPHAGTRRKSFGGTFDIGAALEQIGAEVREKGGQLGLFGAGR